MWEDENKVRQQEFNEAARFAKIVTVPSGNDAILIAGMVIEVNPPHAADLLVRALRSGLRGETGTKVNPDAALCQMVNGMAGTK